MRVQTFDNGFNRLAILIQIVVSDYLLEVLSFLNILRVTFLAFVNLRLEFALLLNLFLFLRSFSHDAMLNLITPNLVSLEES